MNRLFRKAVAVLSAGLMTVAGISLPAFAQEKPLAVENASVAYGATVSKPVYSIKGEKGYRKIRLTSATSGATIYYTKDGTTPTTSSAVLRSGYVIKITSTTKIKAIAVKNGVKSDVMIKTVVVPTKVGDVTGDGKVTSNDYTRLNSYLKGNTSYICKDNADANGDGSVTSADLTLIYKYIKGTISKFPVADEPDEPALSKPAVSVFKDYGGKRIEISSNDKNVTYYYTTNGTSPTRNSTRYTGPFIIDRDMTIKAIAYKDGAYSDIKTRSVAVDECADVRANMPTTTNYITKISVQLSCPTSGTRIYYTLDGTIPTSRSLIYTGPIELTKNTTIKAIASAKGYADSNVATFTYSVTYNDTINISGYVWNDTYSSYSSANGIRISSEPGISGIKVALYDISKNINDASAYPYVTRTNSDGSYAFNNVTKANYRVVFEYNYQKYRPYGSIVSGGNQALPVNRVPDFYVNSSGAFQVSDNKQISRANSYAVASASTDSFLTTAITNNIYNSTVANVNCAFISNVYGSLRLEMKSDVTGAEIYKDSPITYTITLYNDSPAQVLRDAEIYVYIDSKISGSSLNQATYGFNQINSYANGYNVYSLTKLCAGGIGPNSSKSCNFTGKVVGNPDTKISCCAQVMSYRFDGGCYDRNSIPGNMSVGLRASEYDESITPAITIKDPGTNPSSGETTPATTGQKFELRGTNGETLYAKPGSTVIIEGYLENSKNGPDDLYYQPTPLMGISGNLVTSTPPIVSVTKDTATIWKVTITLVINPSATVGDSATLTVALKTDSSQVYYKTITVQA